MSWPKGKKKSEEHRVKLSKALIGKPHSDERKANNSKSTKLQRKREKEDPKKWAESNAKRSKANTGKKRTPAQSKAQSERMLDVPRGPHSDEHKAKLRKAKLGKKQSEEHKANNRKVHRRPEVRVKVRKALKVAMNKPETKARMRAAQNKPEAKARMKEATTENWKDPIYQEVMRKARGSKPNKKEIQLNGILQSLFPNEYKYVGDFKFFVGGKNPDFVNINGKKKLIELFGDYWHKGENSQNRINHFKKYGWDTLVIWEKELKDRSRLKVKLLDFYAD